MKMTDDTIDRNNDNSISEERKIVHIYFSEYWSFKLTWDWNGYPSWSMEYLPGLSWRSCWYPCVIIDSRDEINFNVTPDGLICIEMDLDEVTCDAMDVVTVKWNS